MAHTATAAPGTLQLDHVLCMVDPEDDWEQRLEAGRWTLDAGTSHPGQGTRNRRLVWAQQYLELVWIEDRADARTNPLRLDRRADWARTGASPFGFGLRGQPRPEQRAAFWLYTDLGFRIWVHRDNEHRPDRPLVFVLDLPPRSVTGHAESLLRIDQHGPAPADVPAYAGPRVLHRPGPHRLELFVDAGHPVDVAGHLAIRIA